MNTLTRNNTSTAFINVTNGLLLLSITFSTVMLKDGRLEIPTQGHIKITCTGY